jgi:hypothetical protein
MGVRRPDWWCYPERCQKGHEWGPGLITVSWVLCDCPTARATSGGGAAGHMAVFCNVKGCQSVWYRPRHEPQALPGVRPLTSPGHLGALQDEQQVNRR